MTESVVTHAQLIQGWFSRAKGGGDSPTEFDQFVFLWFSFNAWANWTRNVYEDSGLWQWFAEQRLAQATHTELLHSDSMFRSDLIRLSLFSVRDMRDPGNNRKAVRLSRVESLYMLMKVIYRIRCNLFHGEKSLENPHDVELVQLAYRILVKLLDPFVARLAS